MKYLDLFNRLLLFCLAAFVLFGTFWAPYVDLDVIFSYTFTLVSLFRISYRLSTNSLLVKKVLPVFFYLSLIIEEMNFNLQQGLSIEHLLDNFSILIFPVTASVILIIDIILMKYDHK